MGILGDNNTFWLGVSCPSQALRGYVPAVLYAVYIVDNESIRDGRSAQPSGRHLLFYPAHSTHCSQYLALHLRRCPLLPVTVLRPRRLGNHWATIAVHIPRCCLQRLVFGQYIQYYTVSLPLFDVSQIDFESLCTQ